MFCRRRVVCYRNRRVTVMTNKTAHAHALTHTGQHTHGGEGHRPQLPNRNARSLACTGCTDLPWCGQSPHHPNTRTAHVRDGDAATLPAVVVRVLPANQRIPMHDNRIELPIQYTNTSFLYRPSQRISDANGSSYMKMIMKCVPSNFGLLASPSS